MTDLQLERFLMNKLSWGFSHKGNIIVHSINNKCTKTWKLNIDTVFCIIIHKHNYHKLSLQFPMEMQPFYSLFWYSNHCSDLLLSLTGVLSMMYMYQGWASLALMKRCKYLNAQNPGNWTLIFCIIIQIQILPFSLLSISQCFMDVWWFHRTI